MKIRNLIAVLLLAGILIFAGALPASANPCHIASAVADCNGVIVYSCTDPGNWRIQVEAKPCPTGQWQVFHLSGLLNKSVCWWYQHQWTTLERGYLGGYNTLRISLLDSSGGVVHSVLYPQCGCMYCTPTAVGLGSFTAGDGRGGVLVQWETASEVGNIGFNLYRTESTDPGAPRVKLNSELIPSQNPGSVGGASYTWLDKTAKAGKVYLYWLEDVDTSGHADLHGPVQGQWSKPVANYVSPASGGQVYSTPQKFNAGYRDLDSDLAIVYLLIADSADPSVGVQVRYDRRTGQFALNNQTRATLKSGSAQVLEEGKLKISVVLTFKAGFRGTHNL